MSVIAPTITVETTDEFKTAIERLQPFAQRVHIDISDGIFAPTFLLDEKQIYWPKEWIVDIHAMVSKPEEHLASLIALKPNLIVFHAETGANLAPIFEEIKRNGIKAGLALQKFTVPMTVEGAIKSADHVLVFSGDLGHYGGVASMMQLEKVRLIKAINPAVEIGWDGGVTIENAYTLTQGGVEVLNVGSEIAESADPSNAYATLVKEINKHGVI
jgi:ribulose-phosphate 3-epimerase